MTVTTPTVTTPYADGVVCAPRAGTLYDVLELILDRGMVIDIFVRVSLVGIEILKIDARIVVASVDTYLRFAEACNRLDLEHDSGSVSVPELFGVGGGGGGGGAAKTAGKAIGKKAGKKAASSVADKAKKAIGVGDDEDDEDDGERESGGKRGTTRARSSAKSPRSTSRSRRPERSRA